VPVLNNVRYASDSNHSRYESELTLWAKSRLMHRNIISEPNTKEPSRGGLSELPLAFFVQATAESGT
jgi:hypothetical protein